MRSLTEFLVIALVVTLTPGPATANVLRVAARDGRRAALSVIVGNSGGVLMWGVLSAVGVSSLILASRIAYDTLRIGGAVVLIVMGIRVLWQRRHGIAAVAATDPAGAVERGAVGAAESGAAGAAERDLADATGSGRVGAAGRGLAGAVERDLADATGSGRVGAAERGLAGAAERDLADATGPGRVGAAEQGLAGAAERGVAGAGERRLGWLVRRRGPGGWRSGLVTSVSNPKLAVFFVALFPQFVTPGSPVLPYALGMAVVIVLLDVLWFSTLAVAVDRATSIIRPKVRLIMERFTGLVMVGLGIRLATDSH